MSKGKDMTYSNKILFTKVGGRVDLGHIGKRIKKVFRKYFKWKETVQYIKTCAMKLKLYLEENL